MTREDITKMAQEAGFEQIADAPYWHPYFERFAALVAEHERAAEREACAEYAAVLAEAGWSAWSIADALRARGSK